MLRFDLSTATFGYIAGGFTLFAEVQAEGYNPRIGHLWETVYFEDAQKMAQALRDGADPIEVVALYRISEMMQDGRTLLRQCPEYPNRE